MRDGATVHATCVVLGEIGVLIRGPSGSGKSQLGRRLVSAYSGFARLVCDDRVHIEAVNGRLIARAVPVIAGMLEIRGVGLVRTTFEPSTVVRLLVDALPQAAERLPEQAETIVEIAGIALPRVAGPLDPLADAVLWRVNAIVAGT